MTAAPLSCDDKGVVKVLLARFFTAAALRRACDKRRKKLIHKPQMMREADHFPFSSHYLLFNNSSLVFLLLSISMGRFANPATEHKRRWLIEAQ